MNLFRRIWGRAMRMCRLAYIVFRLSLILSCLMLAGALLTLIAAGAPSVMDLGLYRTGMELLRLPSGVLLLGILVSVCIEDMKA